MAAGFVNLPGGSGRTATAADLQRAAEDASELARELMAAQYATDSVAEDKLENCQLSVIRIGHVLGLAFAHVKRFSSEITMQRAQLDMEAGVRKFRAEQAGRAASRDGWKHRAEYAEHELKAAREQLRLQAEELEHLRGPPLHLVAAE